MALTTPILYTVNAFDATQAQTFTFNVIGGSQVVASTLTIKDNATLATVYSKTQTTYKFAHDLPANTLTNGSYYQATLTTQDAQGNVSNASSPIQFYCYSQPSFEITNMPNGNVIHNSSFAFEVMYNQEQGEILNAYVYNLYSASGALISTSNTVYNTDTTLPLVVSYLFSGFEDKASYSIEVTGVTANGTEITTGKINFTTDYTESNAFAFLFLTNNCKGGYITIKSNVIGIDGKSNPDTPTYINNEEIDLTNVNSYVEWNKGYSIGNDWTMRFWGRKYTPNTEILRFSNIDGDIITIDYCTKGTTTEKTTYTWEKYSVSTSYSAQSSKYGQSITSPSIPSDADTSMKYGSYTLNSQTGVFTLENSGYSSYPYYNASTSSNKIYRYTKSQYGTGVGLYYTYTIQSVATYSKGSTYYGTVTSDSQSDYPENGEQDGYWYVLISSSTSTQATSSNSDDGECWFELKAKHYNWFWGYVTESNHIAIPNATEQIVCWLRRVDNLYDIRIENRGVET